jgi:hypothetical protein
MNSTQTSLDLLASQVQKLEASNRRWKSLNALLLLSAVSVGVMGAKPADRVEPNVLRVATIEAQEFILKDGDGRVHARLSLSRPSVLGMKQPNGLLRVVPMMVPGQAALQFYDERGQVLWTAPSEPMLIPVK